MGVGERVGVGVGEGVWLFTLQCASNQTLYTIFMTQ